MQTKEQKRSAFALVQVEKVFGIPVDKETANFVVGVPTMVLANGLGQTLAFLLSKQKDQHTKTFSVVRKWLEQEVPGLKGGTDLEFLQSFAALDQGIYLQAQQETLALLQWLKRYVRAFEKGEKGAKE
ncbi:MAG: type III-B CRISPR module-associated protein Cmr5 [Desulfoprunum sp.]|jgi:CRISPR-associated protein Cmr5|uniref:type III-B CRISPR module-associated protein Cmr5 n=1 Tax=Desulfoprunum sp. TaxID=2020866 RepID=UPI003C785DBA